MSLLAETKISDTLQFNLADDKKREMSPQGSFTDLTATDTNTSTNTNTSTQSKNKLTAESAKAPSDPSSLSSSSASSSSSSNTSVSAEDNPFAIMAPSIDEVNQDPEELRTLRGEGRYFGVVDPSDVKGDKSSGGRKKCRKCNQPGHLAKSCKTVLCMLCGMINDHYTEDCQKSIKCSNCNSSGHYRSQCPKKWKKTFCQICNSSRHVTERCPDVWRSYKLKTTSTSTTSTKNNDFQNQDKDQDRDTKLVLRWDLIWCYNCGKKGHFGDDCDEPRSSRVPLDDGSAFSGYNLQTGLQGKYFDNLSEQQDDYSYYNNNNSRNGSSGTTSNSRNISGRSYGSLSGSSYTKNDLIQNNSNQSKQGGRNSYNFYKPPYKDSRFQNSSKNNLNNYTNNTNNNNNNPLTFPRGGSMYDYDDNNNNNNYKKRQKRINNDNNSMNNSRYGSSAPAPFGSSFISLKNNNQEGNYYDTLNKRNHSSSKGSNKSYKISKKKHSSRKN